MNVIPLLQSKTADTAIQGFLQVTPGPFPDYWVGPGDEASAMGWSSEQKSDFLNHHTLFATSSTFKTFAAHPLEKC